MREKKYFRNVAIEPSQLSCDPQAECVDNNAKTNHKEEIEEVSSHFLRTHCWRGKNE